MNQKARMYNITPMLTSCSRLLSCMPMVTDCSLSFLIVFCNEEKMVVHRILDVLPCHLLSSYVLYLANLIL
jgi:hypothetical protein